MQASGTLALNDTGQSNLRSTPTRRASRQIGKLVDQPLAGIGKIDATVTGNRRELQAAGNLVGDGVKYGDNGALTVVERLHGDGAGADVADATVVADTHATFVTVAGQDINELDAKTTYQQKQLDFDATAKQPQRSLGAAGSLRAASGPSGSPSAAARPRRRRGRRGSSRQDREATINYGTTRSR